MPVPTNPYTDLPVEVYQCFTNAWLHHHAVRGSASAAQELANRNTRGDKDAGIWYRIYLGHIYE